jgi:ankyrin repeat protein
MNRFIQAVTARDLSRVTELLSTEPKWRTWSQPDGKNALHILCGTPLVAKWNVPASELESPDPADASTSLSIAKLLIKNGIDINSVHQIPDKNCDFPATPVWYAYTRGRNEKLYRWLLKNGGDPENCMFAIVWNDDVKAAKLFHGYGAKLTDDQGRGTPLAAAVHWKRYEMVQWLLKNGADPNAADQRGRTPLQIALKRKHPPEIINLLRAYGAR